MSNDKITLTVDDIDVQVTPGQQLIQALWEADVSTPNFCYHEDLSVAGNCRVCLCEIEGPRGWALMISCHMPIRPGMKVRTHISSEKVRKARKGVMEFLLVNHPLDCPICDKAGECTLQEHYMSSGRHDSRLDDNVAKQYKGAPEFRFTDTKGNERGGKHIDLGPNIVLDQERCILCSRCVRFMDEVAGEEQLYIAGRGDHAYITTFPGDPLDHNYDLCTTDVCPVGALTGKHFRFQQRVWFLKKTNSIAPDDSLGANLTIEYNNEKVWRLMPRRNPDVNKSWIHNDTRMLYKQLDENRLLGGVVGDNDVTLADAYQAAGEALSKAKKIALIASGHLTNEDNAALLALAEKLGDKAEVFGGSWLTVEEGDGIARSGDPVANRKGLELLGIQENLDDLANRASEFDVVVSIGHNYVAADADKAAKINAIKERIVFASWKDETVAKATIALGIRAWAEVRGTMVNCNGLVQQMNACPVCPNHDLDPCWEALVRLSGQVADQPLPWIGVNDAWKAVRARVPAIENLSFAAIGAHGYQIEVAEVVEASA